MILFHRPIGTSSNIISNMNLSCCVILLSVLSVFSGLRQETGYLSGKVSGHSPDQPVLPAL